MLRSFIPKRRFLAIIDQFERGVRLSFGRHTATCEPGLRLKIPIYHQMYYVDLREKVVGIKPQNIVTQDNVSCQVDATVRFKVSTPEKAILEVNDYYQGTVLMAEVVLREVLGTHSVNEILSRRDDLAKAIKDQLANLSEKWGVDVNGVQIKDILFNEAMTRAMARPAEAERTAQAKIINAKADVETAHRYREAARIYGENPTTLRLREFQVLSNISQNSGTSIYFFPSEILNGGVNLGKGDSDMSDLLLQIESELKQGRIEKVIELVRERRGLSTLRYSWERYRQR